MLKTSPNPIDVQDFQFKLLCKLKVFDNSIIEQFSKKCCLITTASQYGLLFVGTKTSFQAIRCVDLEQCSVKEGDKEDYVRREIQINSIVTHLSVNCDGTILAVVYETDSCPAVQFYDVSSMFTNQVKVLNRLQLSPTPGTGVLEIGWNPTNPEMFTACKSDGSLGVYEIKKEVNITELPAGACASCFSWSPKGKQIAVGSRDGKITQYKPADMKAARVIAAPPIANCQIAALQWLSSFQFIGVYVSSQGDDVRCHVVVVDAPKNGAPTYIDYDDVCFSSTPVRPIQFYIILQPQWNILMISSSNSMEVAVLQQTGETWTQLTLMDSARAELPLSPDHSDTLPVGFALDTSSVQPLPWGEGALPPTPRIFLLSHCGVLCCFNVVNLKENVPSICEAPKQNLEIIPSLFTKGNIQQSSNDKLTTLPQSIESLSKVLPKTTIVATTFPNTAPLGTSIFAFGDSQGVSQDKSNIFKMQQPTMQPGGQSNRVIFGGTPQTHESNKLISGNTYSSVPITKVTFGHSQPIIQQSKPGIPDSSFNSENKMANVITFNKPSIQDAKQDATTTSRVTLETGKSGLLGSHNLQKQSNIQHMQKFTETSPLSVSAIAKPQAVFSQKSESDTTVDTNETNIVDDVKVSDDELDGLLAHMILEECITLESELKALLHENSELTDIIVGANSEKVNMVQSTSLLGEFLNEVVNNNAVQKSDVHILKQNLIQSWAWLEEARSKYYMANDSTIVAILRAQPLDSAAEKQLHHIKHLMYYLESQLKQAHDALDDQWENFQNYCHKSCKMQLPAIEAIFKTMIKHNAIFQKFTYSVKDISAKIKARNQLKLKSPALVDLDSLKKIEHEMSILSVQPEDIFNLQYNRILKRNKLVSSNKTQKLRNLLKQSDIKRISSFKSIITEPKLQTLREASNLKLGLDRQKNISPVKGTIATKENKEPLTFSSATTSIPLTSLSVPSKEKTHSTLFTKPLSFGSAFVPTSVSSPSFFDASSSTTAPFKNVLPVPNEKSSVFTVPSSTATANEKSTVFTVPATVTPLTTASQFALTGTAKSYTNKPSISGQIQGNTPPYETPGFTQKTLSYTVDQTKNLTFEYPNPMNPSSPIIVIEGSNMPLTSTPKSYGFKLPTDEISILKVPGTHASKPVFNISKDIGIIKSDRDGVPSLSGTNKLGSGNITHTPAFQTASKPDTLVDVGSSGLITFKRSDVPLPSKETSCNADYVSITKAITASQLTQPLGVSSTKTTSSNLFGLSSHEILPASSISKPAVSQPTLNMFTATKVTETTKSSTQNISQVSTSHPSSVVSSTSQSNKDSFLSSTNIFGSLSNVTTKKETKSVGSIFNASGTTVPTTIYLNTISDNTIQSQIAAQPTSTPDPKELETTKINNPNVDESFTTAKSVFGNLPLQIPSLMAVSNTDVTSSAADDHAQLSQNVIPVSTQAKSFATGNLISNSSKDNGNVVEPQTVPFGATSVPTTTAASQSITLSTTSSSIFATVQPSLVSSSTQGSIFATPFQSTTGNIFGGSSTPTVTTTASIFGGFRVSSSTDTPASSIFGTSTPSTASTFETTKVTTTSILTSPVTSTTTEQFNGAVASTVPKLFGTASSTSAFKSTPTTTTTHSLFGVPQVTSSASPFSTGPVSTPTSVFGTAVSSSVASPFGAAVSSTSPFSGVSKPIFGNTSAFASTSSSAFAGSGSIFGTPANTSSTESDTSVFVTQSPGFATFGNATTTSQSFQQPPPTFGSVFGGTPATSSVPASGTNLFGTSNAQFGTASSTSGSLFGASAAISNTSGFVSSTSSAPSFGFGGLSVGPTPATSQFGNTAANPFAKSSSIFSGTPSTQPSIFGGGAQQTQSSSIFGSVTPSSQSASVFGGNSAFGQSTAHNAFGGAPTFGGAPAFGQQPTFGQSTFGSPQPGPFSGGNQSIAQTGFGSPSAPQKPGGFGSPPAFGSSTGFGSAPSFGGAPTFGSTTSFGSPGKVFGGSAPLGGFQAPTQESSTFANLANQNTVGFGSLAQQAQNSSSSPFSGNSSFSSWR